MEESTEHTLADPKDKLILVVDDDESLIELMEHLIQKEGFRTARSMNGADALQKAEKLSPDLIVLDMMLPGMGGYEVIRELQAQGLTSIPIIVITGRAMDRKNVEMVRLESNVKEYMEKPLRPAVLATTIHALLKTRPADIDRGAHSRRGPMSGGIF